MLPVALAAGIVLQLVYPGDFELRSAHGGPALATWIALWGGLAGIVAAIVLARRASDATSDRGSSPGSPSRSSSLPVAVHGFAHWRRAHAPGRECAHARPRPVPARGRAGARGRLRRPRDELPHLRLRAGLRRQRAADACRGHEGERPDARRDALLEFLRTDDLAIPRRYGAGWLVLRGDERVGPGARLVYRDERFRVYRL